MRIVTESEVDPFIQLQLDIERAMRGFPKSAIMSTSGQPFSFEDRSTWKFSLIDTVHALSHINRFVGNSAEPYSVLQHSLWCLRNVVELTLDPSGWGYTKWAAEVRLQAGSHDFAEAVLGDVSSPMKSQPWMKPYVALEADVLANQWEQFGIPSMTTRQEECVEAIDRIAFLTETRDLRGGADFAFLPREIIRPKRPGVVRAEFMHEFQKLLDELENDVPGSR